MYSTIFKSNFQCQLFSRDYWLSISGWVRAQHDLKHRPSLPLNIHGRPQGSARGGPCPSWKAKIVGFIDFFFEENSIFLGAL